MLVVRHKDREARLTLGCEDPSEVAFGAFYADCVHEVLPVTAGHRLVLVYNLVRRDSERLPTVPDYAGEVAMVAERLERWAGGLDEEGRRDDRVGCDCQDCRALARFLGDATQKQWVFAAAQHRRSHVEDTIRNRRCDVDHTTEKRGSPHRLVCTKNQASYQRRCDQRADDLKARARLAASG